MTNDIKNCKYCRSEMPKDAKICLSCGKRQGGVLKYILIVLAVFVVIGLVAAGSGKSNKPQKVNSDNTVEDNSENVTSTKEDEKDVFMMGETAELENVQVTLTNYEESEGSQFNKPSDGKIFVLAEFEIANNSDKELAISSILSFKAYADNYSLNYSLGAMINKSNSTLDGSVAPGKKMKGWIGYEVDANWQQIEIDFTHNVWESRKFKFLIEK